MAERKKPSILHPLIQTLLFYPPLASFPLFSPRLSLFKWPFFFSPLSVLFFNTDSLFFTPISLGLFLSPPLYLLESLFLFFPPPPPSAPFLIPPLSSISTPSSRISPFVYSSLCTLPFSVLPQAETYGALLSAIVIH